MEQGERKEEEKEEIENEPRVARVQPLVAESGPALSLGARPRSPKFLNHARRAASCYGLGAALLRYDTKYGGVCILLVIRLETASSF